MALFDDIQDVRDWLEPLDYIAFWKAVEPYRLTLQDRDHCDALIASGAVDARLILDVLKGLARMELARSFNLKDRVDHRDIPAVH